MKTQSQSKQKIEVFFDEEVSETSFGGIDRRYYHDTVYEEEGILLGEKIICSPYSAYDFFQCGFKLWLLSADRLGIHFFHQESHTSGKNSGPGYTRCEETRTIYEAPLRRVARIRENTLGLESEIKERIIEVKDIRRVEYSFPVDNDTEFHILDWDENEKRWTNSLRYSYGLHVWQKSCMDEDAMKELRREFEPIAKKLGVEYFDSDARKLVEASAIGGRGYLGSYKEGLYREPYPGELQRGETPSINVDIYQKKMARLFFLKNVLIKTQFFSSCNLRVNFTLSSNLSQKYP